MPETNQGHSWNVRKRKFFSKSADTQQNLKKKINGNIVEIID